MWKAIPAPQAARYSATGDPKPPAPTTKIDDLESFDCPALYKETKTQKMIWGEYHIRDGILITYWKERIKQNESLYCRPKSYKIF